MRQVAYTDPEGRKFMVWLPAGVDDALAGEVGAFIGPPSLSPLGLPRRVEVALNNELFHRRLFTFADVKQRRVELQAALMAALKIDATTLFGLFSIDGESL